MEFKKKKWTAAKKQYKSSIKRVERALARHKDLTTEDLEVRKNILTEAYTNYKESIINLLALDEPCEEDDDTEDCYMSTLANIERQLKLRISWVNSKLTESSQGIAKLPSLDIPVYDGKDISSYKPFIEMFHAPWRRPHFKHSKALFLKEVFERRAITYNW